MNDQTLVEVLRWWFTQQWKQRLADLERADWLRQKLEAIREKEEQE